MALYPAFAIHNIQDQHGFRWAQLIEGLKKLSISDPRVMAFSFSLRRLGATDCQDTLCAVCANEVLMNSGKNEDELLKLYEDSLHAIHACIANRTVKPRKRMSWREAVA